MYFVLSGEKYPVIIQCCENERQQKNQYKKRNDSGVWKRVEMVTGNYNVTDFDTWEVCDNE